MTHHNYNLKDIKRRLHFASTTKKPLGGYPDPKENTTDETTQTISPQKNSTQ